jgi:hypothetical protein
MSGGNSPRACEYMPLKNKLLNFTNLFRSHSLLRTIVISLLFFPQSAFRLHLSSSASVVKVKVLDLRAIVPWYIL